MSSPAKVTYPCQSHALPFRTILGEYRVRREQELAAAVAKHILDLEEIPADRNTVWEGLDKALTASEDAYVALADMKYILENIAREAGETEEAYHERVRLGYSETLHCERACKNADRALKDVLHAMQGTALCLSGGGIRSASFSLGILQGLARFSRNRECVGEPRPLLDNLDYLSTVSGGGYIGSWLMAWAKRSNFHSVVTQLAAPAPTSGDPESQPIRHLREYTSYLTPRYGFTLDTLTLVAIVLRNMILNWLTLLPIVICLLCLPQLLWIVSYAWPQVYPAGPAWYRHVMWTAVFLVAVASAFSAWRTAWPPHESGAKALGKQKRKPSLEVWLFVLPLLGGSWLLGEIWLKGALRTLGGASAAHPVTFGRLFHWQFWFAVVPPFLMALMRLRLLYQADGTTRSSPFHKHDGTGRLAWGRLGWSLIAPLLAAAFAAALLAACSMFLRNVMFAPGHDPEFATQGALVLSVPVIWLVLMLASSFLSGLLSNIEQEEEREWWARAGGLFFGYILLWTALNAVAFFADDVLHFVHATAYAALGLGVASGYLGSMVGFSGVTAHGLKGIKLEQLSKTQQWLSKHDAVAPVVSAVALLCITVALADFTIWLRGKAAFLSAIGLDFLKSHPSIPSFFFSKIGAWNWGAMQIKPGLDLRIDFVSVLTVFAGAAVLAVMGNLFINVNTFSLHGMYRMRLTRAYLGASNFARHPDAFTNFDPRDNLYEAEVPCHAGKGHAPPLHVIATALNIVGTHNLAWQQRKAESFTFSSVSCGSWRLGYLDTREYGGSRGVRLGTAMAISGAAFNPNMGYHSSPLVTLLMTFFNARLGWWLPNPIWPILQNWDPQSARAKKYLHRSGPKWALMPLLNEALGHTDDRYAWIELSDGGHFENLGLYEMVMRRCHSIIVVDADADGDYQFEDLGNAIRTIEIDFGIPITFSKYGKNVPMQKGIKDTNLYCLEGEIGYQCVDPGQPNGRLLYIKPVLNGSEPPDIRSYRASHEAFPHEPTTNQFFKESQFESYRHLGSWVMETITRQPSGNGMGCDVNTLFTLAEAYRCVNAAATTTKVPPSEAQSTVAVVKLNSTALDEKSTT